MPKIVGAPAEVDIDSVRPNAWNPNTVPPPRLRALQASLLRDGWLGSQALTVWGKDPRGKRQGVIIDGEHRWRAAKAAGFEKVPAVTLDGLTAQQAKRLTIRLNQIRGDFDLEMLSALVQDLEAAEPLGPEDLGFDEAEFARLMASEEAAVASMPEEPEPEPEPEPEEEPRAQLVHQEIKGIAPNLRVPIVFYMDQATAELYKQIFATEKKHELNTDLLRAMVAEYQAHHPGK